MQTVTTVIEHQGELAIIFPDELLDAAGWKMGDEVDWRMEGNVVVLSKSKAKFGRKK
ncbi:MAG: AbrB/MazE/SpoVT family DNA-binding domain-containing protein [Sphingomicrobium sp.]